MNLFTYITSSSSVLAVQCTRCAYVAVYLNTTLLMEASKGEYECITDPSFQLDTTNCDFQCYVSIQITGCSQDLTGEGVGEATFSPNHTSVTQYYM